MKAAVCRALRAAGSAAMQYENVPRKTPRVHCVTRSFEKLTMMRGENCIDAKVRVISRMAKTMETTVMRFLVSVPVLSVHNTVVAPRVSIANA